MVSRKAIGLVKKNKRNIPINSRVAELTSENKTSSEIQD